MEKGWTGGSEVEACGAEYHSFVQKQRQLERSSTRSRPDVGDVLSFCSAQAGFRARRHLYKLCIVSDQACCFDPYELSCPLYELLLFQVLQLTNHVMRGHATHGESFIISLDRVAIKQEEKRGVLVCVQDFVRSAHFTQRSFFSESGLTMLSGSVAITDSLTLSTVYAPGVSGVHYVRARSSLICVLIGIGLHCVVAIPKTQVSVGTMVAALGVRQHQGQGWEYPTSLRRGAPSMCQLLHLLLVLVGQSKFVLPPASGGEKSLGAPWSCLGSLKYSVPLLLPGSDLWWKIIVLHQFWRYRLLMESPTEVGGIDVPPQYSRWAFLGNSLLYYVFRCFLLFSASLTCFVFCVYLNLMNKCLAN